MGWIQTRRLLTSAGLFAVATNSDEDCFASIAFSSIQALAEHAAKRLSLPSEPEDVSGWVDFIEGSLLMDLRHETIQRCLVAIESLKSGNALQMNDSLIVQHLAQFIDFALLSQGDFVDDKERDAIEAYCMDHGIHTEEQRGVLDELQETLERATNRAYQHHNQWGKPFPPEVAIIEEPTVDHCVIAGMHLSALYAASGLDHLTPVEVIQIAFDKLEPHMRSETR